MKTFFLAILGVLIFANAKAQLIFPQEQWVKQDVASLMAYLTQSNASLQAPGISLNLTFYKQSLASHHYTFEVRYQNMALLHALIKVNTDLSGKVLSIKNENIQTARLAFSDLEQEKTQWEKLDISGFFDKLIPINNYAFKIDNSGERPWVVAVVNSYSKTFDNTYVINRQGQIIEEWNNSRYLNVDTLVHGQVFKPDPLTFLGLTYGAPYIDDNDNNLAWFTPAYQAEDVEASYDNGNNTFYLENQWVHIDDFDAPTILPATSATPNFVFNRSESGFEDVNALYHITAFHHYISSIGYDTLMDDFITVDTHGMQGGDNSMFNRNGGNPTLDFGPGGIDDAEDADVIIHEYSHALSWSANNNDNFTTARSGLDEGLADYFATSYSRSINPFNWEKVFSWDGNAAAWNGRVANTATNYPTGGNLYAVGEIWNAAMSAIWTDLGQIVTDKLMLESMHFFTNSTNLAEAAIYVLQSDTILFGGIHTNTLCTHFKNKNIVDANCMPTSVKEVALKENGIQVKNTYGFTFNQENIEIVFPYLSSGEITVLDMQGKKVYQEKFLEKTKISCNPTNIARGTYLLQINTGKEWKAVTICR